MKKKYICCIWCGGDIPKHKKYAKYCDVKCSNEATGKVAKTKVAK